MNERKFEQSINLKQNQLEQEIKENIPETSEFLNTLEQKKINESTLEKDRINNKKVSDGREIQKKILKENTPDFIEKHGKITKKKKKHTGKGIAAPRSRKKSRYEINKYKQLRQELKDYNINHPDEWRKTLNLEEGIERSKHNFEKLLTYLEGEKRISNKEKIKNFSETEDDIEKLELLRTISLGDAIKCLRDYSDNPNQYRYFVNRLDFYQKLFQNKATKKYTTEEYNDKIGQYVEVTREESIDASNVSPETIRLGVLRDMMFAGMIGTPELAVYKIADKRLQASSTGRTHMPELKGYHSYIHEGSIGYAYPFLRDIYQKSRKIIDKKFEGQVVEEEKLEHKAVILAANWLEEAMDYNDSGRGPKSPYASTLEESIAWARLGYGVKRQLRGMRQKIMGVDLHNIKRFIGKSGNNKYEPEKRRLFSQIKFLEESGEQEKIDEFVIGENQFAIQKQDNWHEKETDRIQHKLEKQLQEIEKAKLPEDEKQLQIESVKAKYNTETSIINADYQEHMKYYQSRTAEQLLQDLKKIQSLVEQRHEKRKSLAQKALDLHFHFNYNAKYKDDDGDVGYENKPYLCCIDWINDAPLGTIKRAHKMFQKGINDDIVIKISIANMIFGQDINRKNTDKIYKMIKESTDNYQIKEKLQFAIKINSILNRHNYTLSFDELFSLSNLLDKSSDRKDFKFENLSNALKEFSLNEVKEFLNQDCSLYKVTKTKKIYKKLNYDFNNKILIEMTSHNIDGLENASSLFELDAIMVLLKQDVYLPTAVSVLNSTKQFGYELTATQIANIAKNVGDIEDFKSAMQELSLAEVEKLFSVDISYYHFNTVKESLERYKHKSDFASSFAMAQKLSGQDEYGDLGDALEIYTLKEVDKILANGLALSNVIGIRNSLAKKEIKTNLEETIQFTELIGDWNHGQKVEEAIDTFGIDDVRKIASKNCRLDKAVEINNYINNERSSGNVSEEFKQSLKKGGLDVIVAIAKAGNMEAAVKTIGAGFTIEEITRFPFLISSLVTKK